MQNNDNNVSNKQISMLLNAVAKKMGKTPEQLERDLKNGNYPTEKVQDFMNSHNIEDVIKSSGMEKLLNDNKK